MVRSPSDKYLVTKTSNTYFQTHHPSRFQLEVLSSTQRIQTPTSCPIIKSAHHKALAELPLLPTSLHVYKTKMPRKRVRSPYRPHLTYSSVSLPNALRKTRSSFGQKHRLNVEPPWIVRSMNATRFERMTLWISRINWNHTRYHCATHPSLDSQISRDICGR
jgi:hypothetical protein